MFLGYERKFGHEISNCFPWDSGSSHGYNGNFFKMFFYVKLHLYNLVNTNIEEVFPSVLMNALNDECAILEFIDQSAIENGDVDSNLLPIKNSIEAESHVIPSLVPIDAVVRFSKPHFDSKEDNDVPLSRLKASKGDEEWKWRKKLE